MYAATHPAAHVRRPDAPARERNIEAEAELFAALGAEAAEEDAE